MNGIWNFLLSKSPDFAAQLVVGIILLWLGMKFFVRKKIVLYKVLAEDNLLNIADENARQHIQVRYLTTENQYDVIENLYLFKIRIFNAGDVETKVSDFDPPTITVEFGKNARVLGATIEERSPRNLQINPTWASNGLEQLSRILDGQPISLNKIEVPPVQLNPRDSFVISALVTQPETIVVSGRVLGGKFAEKRNDKSRRIKVSIFFLMAIFTAMFIYVIGEFFPSIRLATFFFLFGLMFIIWILVILDQVEVVW
ncbi:hypothetical protein [Calothrix sp. UHCC 0171]|uniref:hypothetical protein n=1 Tax=Calothrix sp. UHCC 0171 TaxID=3110245 RepID=UPI002B1FAE93|nr:hypothetical protein [Calothrix sp. UHCC 0171]MEA5573622.1 hypothetical protein [Calothrix sp. UHCC 0171]